MSDISDQQTREAIHVTLVGALLDLVLGVLKIGIGLMSSSFALVSDGVHSLSDLVTDAFVLIIARASRAKPDKKHPYGHRRFETVGTIALGIVLFGVACIICYDGVRRLYAIDPLPVPGWPGLLVALASIVSKEWIYRYTRKVADKQNSTLLLANAWHSRTDALSSIAVLIGILGAMLGFPFMDILAAMFVGLMIAHIAWQLAASSLKELVDTALPEEQTQAIRHHVDSLEGIEGLHELRTRQHGGQTFVDVHVQVSSRITVSEGHYLADCLTDSLKKTFPDISDIVVHIDPELDKDEAPNLSRPLRKEAEQIVLNCCQQTLPELDVKRLDLHYLDNKVDVDVFIDKNQLNAELVEGLRQTTTTLPWLGALNVYGVL